MTNVNVHQGEEKLVLLHIVSSCAIHFCSGGIYTMQETTTLQNHTIKTLLSLSLS